MLNYNGSIMLFYFRAIITFTSFTTFIVNKGNVEQTTFIFYFFH